LLLNPNLPNQEDKIREMKECFDLFPRLRKDALKDEDFSSLRQNAEFMRLIQQGQE
jgi:hypothetical protein